MRVLLSTIGSRGDVQPLAALASELRMLGVDVRFCVPPDFREWIEGLGFSVTPIGPELRQALPLVPSGTPAPFTPERRRQLAEATVAAQFETVAAAAKDCDAIVAATALQIAARSVAETRRIPYVFVAYAPNVLPSPHHAPPRLPPMPGQPSAPAIVGNDELWTRDRERFNDLFGGALNAHRAAVGLAPVSDVRAHVFTDRPWLAADATLAPWPDAAESVNQTGAWVLPDERPLPSAVDRFLASGEPPIYFGFGSMRAPAFPGEIMVRAARANGRRFIVSRGWANLAPPDKGSDCLAIDEANLQALFTRVAAVVHHGGAGTTTTAALAGAPQVVVPQIYDQPYFAQRVNDLGIGTTHATETPDVDSLTDAIERALTPGVAARATSIAAVVRRDGARAAALQVIRTGRG